MRALGKGRAPVWSVMQLADLGDERVELAVEVAVSGLAHDLLALLRRGEPEEVGAGGGLGLVDPRAVEHDRGVVGRVVSVARVDRHELLLGRVALHAGDAVAARDAAVVVPDGLLVDDHGGEEVGDRPGVLGLARMPEEVLGRRHVVARRELVLAHLVGDVGVLDLVGGQVGDRPRRRAVRGEQGGLARAGDERARLAELERAPLGVPEVRPRVLVLGCREDLVPGRRLLVPADGLCEGLGHGEHDVGCPDARALGGHARAAAGVAGDVDPRAGVGDPHGRALVLGELLEVRARVLGGETRLVLRRDDGHAVAVDVARLGVVAVDEARHHLGVLERREHRHGGAGLRAGRRGGLVLGEDHGLGRDHGRRSVAGLARGALVVQHHGRDGTAGDEHQHGRTGDDAPASARLAALFLTQATLFAARRGGAAAHRTGPIWGSRPAARSPNAALA